MIPCSLWNICIFGAFPTLVFFCSVWTTKGFFRWHSSNLKDRYWWNLLAFPLALSPSSPYTFPTAYLLRNSSHFSLSVFNASVRNHYHVCILSFNINVYMYAYVCTESVKDNQEWQDTLRSPKFYWQKSI